MAPSRPELSRLTLSRPAARFATRGPAALAALVLLLGSGAAPARAGLTGTVAAAVTPQPGGLILYTYLVTNAPTSTGGISEFDVSVSPDAALSALTQPGGFLALYTPGDSYISFLSTDASTDIAPGASGTFTFTSPLAAGLQPDLLRNLDSPSQGEDPGRTLAPAPEPPAFAGLALGALGLLGLGWKAKRRA